MMENKRDLSDSIQSYFYGVSSSIHKLLEERELKNTSISKELVSKLKSARKKPEREYLIYYVLSKYPVSSYLSSKHFPTYIENDIDETIRLIAPMQAELGYSKEEKSDTLTYKNFGCSLAHFLSNNDNKSYENIEKKFLDILAAPKSQLSTRLYSLISILQGSSINLNINWPHLYYDIFNWENNRNVQNKWAIEFYKNLRKDSDHI